MTGATDGRSSVMFLAFPEEQGKEREKDKEQGKRVTFPRDEEKKNARDTRHGKGRSST